ncbi:MAG TPA: mannose-6-phosphate isomerase, class I [Chitinophagaceae bacterium]|nr:mannose-6-phosphate isomerase, class I [Chitinophagaceae bacterium]
MMPGIFRLKGSIKHYDWGGKNFLPSLLHVTNPASLPFAEYWLGTHPHDTCMIQLPGGEVRLLRDFMKECASDEQGAHPIKSQLSYLIKILDVKDMLSIQVHPSKKAAEREFARENVEGVPLGSSRRNYKDDNHKPELMVALGDFWLLHGFKPPGQLRKILTATPELTSLLPIFDHSGYEGLYAGVMKLSQTEVNQMLQPLADRIQKLYSEEKPDPAREDYWAARAAAMYSGKQGVDRGIFSIYFFNLVQLKKGEGIFQDAGLPHAYLEGQNVEIMASSDNVLRGGLTNKHIDVNELLKHVSCEATEVKILKGVPEGEGKKVYQTSAPDFELHVFEINAGSSVNFRPTTTEILLLTEGSAKAEETNNSITMGQGDPAAILFKGTDVKITAFQDTKIFRATLPGAAN